MISRTAATASGHCQGSSRSSPEKTLADCFKYRNKLGLDTVLEALKLYRSRKRPNVDELMKFARVCRVEKVMRPYLEAVLYSS